MKAILALAMVLASTLAVSAQKANPPRDLYCRDMRVGNSGTVPYCMAYTMEQCLASRASPTERCYLNPIYERR
jgi:hypothetical protein